jgi:hypothetical protein
LRSASGLTTRLYTGIPEQNDQRNRRDAPDTSDFSKSAIGLHLIA